MHNTVVRTLRFNGLGIRNLATGKILLNDFQRIMYPMYLRCNLTQGKTILQV